MTSTTREAEGTKPGYTTQERVEDAANAAADLCEHLQAAHRSACNDGASLLAMLLRDKIADAKALADRLYAIQTAMPEPRS